MAVTINGTNGVTTPEVVLDNSAADGAQVVLKSSGYSDWNLDNYSGRLRAYYGATEYLTVNTSGNVGIGTSSPTTRLDVRGGNGAGGISGSGGTWAAQVVMNQDSSGYGGLSVQTRYATSSTAVFEAAIGYNGSTTGYYPLYTVLGDGSHIWKRAGGGANPESARIDSSGNLLVGTTSNTGAGRIVSYAATSAIRPIETKVDQAGAADHVAFWSSSGFAGRIVVTGTTTAYNTSSDYRLKENVQPITGALARVLELKPCTYTWKHDSSVGEGFIAHELQEVVPLAVSGEKDEVNPDGSIRPQGIDTSFLVATLTAAIQELKAINDALTARVTALEGQP